MSIYDITLPISNRMPVYPGDPPVRVFKTSSLKQDDPYNLSRLDFSAHTGTHVDAPIHFLESGYGVDSLDLDILCGETLVIEVADVHAISAEDLEQMAIPVDVTRVLLKTDNTQRQILTQDEFVTDCVHLSEDGAQWLADRQVRLIGIDSFSIASVYAPVPVHEVLLKNEVIIVEGLDLRGIQTGVYEMICLPMKISGCDGAPARIILRDMEA